MVRVNLEAFDYESVIVNFPCSSIAIHFCDKKEKKDILAVICFTFLPNFVKVCSDVFLLIKFYKVKKENLFMCFVAFKIYQKKFRMAKKSDTLNEYILDFQKQLSFKDICVKSFRRF